MKNIGNFLLAEVQCCDYTVNNSSRNTNEHNSD